MASLNPAKVSTSAKLVRSELKHRGCPHASSVSNLQLHLLLSRVRDDVGLAADALTMWPRPDWLLTMCGPFPENLEMLNPGDIAHPKEWGPLG